jgi:hypothetical protein
MFDQGIAANQSEYIPDRLINIQHGKMTRSLSDLGCDVARYSLGIKKNDAGAVEFAHRTNCGAENSFS